MKLLLQRVFLLAQDGRFAPEPEPFRRNAYSFWWVIFAVLIVIALCCFILSLMYKEKTTSLWKDKDSEMNSGGIGHE